MEGWRQWRLGGEKSLDSDRPSHGRWQHRLKRERPTCSERTAHQRLRMEGWRQWRLGGEKSLDSDRPSHGRRYRKCALFIRLKVGILSAMGIYRQVWGDAQHIGRRHTYILRSRMVPSTLISYIFLFRVPMNLGSNGCRACNLELMDYF